MAKTKRMMETDEETKVQRQFFPITHASAVLGLGEVIAGDSTVLSVNGKTGTVVLTKDDLGLSNAITELPYASEEADGIITAEMYQEILNGGEGSFSLPIATNDRLGGVKIGNLLTVDEDGQVSAVRQTDLNFTVDLKEKLDALKNYTAGENITISENGTISSNGSGSYSLPTASEFVKGGIRVGDGLSITNDVLSADRQFNYTAGANISISNTGIISATGGGEGGGVSQAYVDQKMSEAYQSAVSYTDAKTAVISFEKVGEV